MVVVELHSKDPLTHGGVGVAATSLDLVRGGRAGGNAHPLLFSFYGLPVDATNLR